MNRFLRWARSRQGMVILTIILLVVVLAALNATIDGGLTGAAGFIRPTSAFTKTPIP